MKLRGGIIHAYGEAGRLVVEIQENPKWSWANNDQNKHMLEVALEALVTSANEFHREFETQDVLKLKKTIGHTELKRELDLYVRRRDNYYALAEIIETIKKRHQA